jgi:predicted restriction endonuclease
VDPLMVNRHLSKGWDKTSNDFQNNDDLFFNNWVGEVEKDFEYEYEDDYEDDEDEDEIEDDEEDEKSSETSELDNVILIEHHQNKRDFIMALSKVFARDRDKSAFLKYLYQDTCQVCGHRIDFGNGETYSETHHIQPRSEDGPDEFENMIVLCSNCHTHFDRGALTVDLVTKQVFHRDPANTLNNMNLTLKHTIGQRYINYNNLMKFRGLATIGERI